MLTSPWPPPWAPPGPWLMRLSLLSPEYEGEGSGLRGRSRQPPHPLTPLLRVLACFISCRRQIPRRCWGRCRLLPCACRRRRLTSWPPWELSGLRSWLRSRVPVSRGALARSSCNVWIKRSDRCRNSSCRIVLCRTCKPVARSSIPPTGVWCSSTPWTSSWNASKRRCACATAVAQPGMLVPP